MNSNFLLIDCPRQLKNSFKTYSFLVQAQIRMQNTSENVIRWNMSTTKIFEVNLLSIIYFIFKEQWDKNKEIIVLLPNKEEYEDSNVILLIFNYYAEDKRSFFKPRLISGNKSRETEDILLKYLKKLNLEKYDTIKTLISEVFANIKMHTENKIGYISGLHEKNKNMLIVSIVNGDYSIAKQLETKRGMIFKNDLSALKWTLKKSNSTRDDIESGGLGLYLLRKYIYHLNGEGIIMSGSAYLQFDSRCFNPEDENLIIVKEEHEMLQEYPGTVITLMIPYHLREEDIIIKSEHMTTINLLDIMGK